MAHGMIDPLEGALESWFKALESGEIPDIQTICRGDTTLMEELRQATDSEQLFIDSMQGSCGPGEKGLPAEVLGEFRLRHAIGKGGMGRVYLAEQVGLGRMVALKVLDEKAMGDPRAKLRFKREAEITAALDHPNIVPIYGFGEDKGFFYIAMKWLTGPGLDEGNLNFSPQRVAEIGACVARCLEQTHACGVVHRDIKPANIVLDSDKVFVVDFGLARGRSDPNLTQEGVVAGTLPYLAPEQIESKTAGHDPRTDLYALGATLYSLCAGGPPFEDQDQVRLARRIVLNDPPSLSLPAADRDLEILIQKALEKDPSARFQSAGKFAEELERFATGRAISTRSVGPVRKLVRTVRRRKALSLSLASLAAIAFIFFGLWGLGKREKKLQLDAGLEQVAVAFEGGQRKTARLFALDLLKRDPGNSEAQAWLAQLNARAAYERFMNLAIDPSSDVLVSQLDRALNNCKKYDSRAINPRAFDLAKILADTLCGRKEEAKTALKKFGSLQSPTAPRGACLLALLLEGKPWPGPILQASQSSDESALCASILQSMGRPQAEVTKEIDQALAFGEDRRRPLQMSGSLAFERGEFERARELFMALSNDEQESVLVDRFCAHTAAILGHFKEARAALKRIPKEARGPFSVAIEAAMFRRMGDEKKFAALLQAGLKRWPHHPTLSRYQATVLVALGQQDEALKLLQAATPVFRIGRTYELLEVTKLQVRFAKVIPEGPEASLSLTPEQIELLKEIDRDADRLIAGSRYKLALGKFMNVKAWTSLRLEGVEAALGYTRSAMTYAPHDPFARRTFMTLVFNQVMQGPARAEMDAKDFEDLLMETKDVIAIHVKYDGIGTIKAFEAKVASAYFILANICYSLGDGKGCIAAAKKAAPYYSDDMPGGSWIRAIAGR